MLDICEVEGVGDYFYFLVSEETEIVIASIVEAKVGDRVYLGRNTYEIKEIEFEKNDTRLKLRRI